MRGVDADRVVVTNPARRLGGKRRPRPSGRGFRASVVRRLSLPVGLLAAAFPSTSQAQTADESVLVESLGELHRLVNAHRRDAGCRELRWHEGAARVAEAHSADMSRRDYFDHVTLEGTDLSRRLLKGGVTWHGSIAENLALTARGPETVIDLWVDSPTHRAILEECSFTHHGLGLFEDRWTQVLIERPN